LEKNTLVIKLGELNTLVFKHVLSVYSWQKTLCEASENFIS